MQKWTYAVPGKRSALEVFRNYRKELETAGWQTLWEGKGPMPWAFGFHIIGTASEMGKVSASISPTVRMRCITGRGKLEKPDGVSYAALVVTEFQDGGTKFALEKGQVSVQLDTVRVGGMDEKMVAMKADQMESSIQTAGRVALYGILFDFNKADVKAESAPTLAEIAKHLKSGPGLKLLVAGHTDSVGGFEFNRDLSARRAKAVVTELKGKYGISNDRLFPFGVSFAARSRRTTRRKN
ncbi:MAG: OmpA family protein [Terrimicrobiaceae bacterium]